MYGQLETPVDGGVLELTDLRRTFGYMPQERGLYPKVPVGDQLECFGIPQSHQDERRTSHFRAVASVSPTDVPGRWCENVIETERRR